MDVPRSGTEYERRQAMTTNTTEIISAYTTGNISLEEANRRLAEAGASFVLDPDRCKLIP